MMHSSYHKPVGRCIYCGRTKEEVTAERDVLSGEHIVPKSLGGRVILPEASCGRCRDETHAFEGRCCDKLYADFRSLHNLPTRRPKNRKSYIEMFSETGERLFVPIKSAVATFPVFYLPQAGYWRDPSVKQFGWPTYQAQLAYAIPSDTSYWSDFPEQTVFTKQEFDIDSYALLMAKIAHAYCVFEFGIDAFEAWLPPYILGDDPHLSYVVGSENDNPPPVDRTDRLSEIQWFAGRDDNKWLLWVNIRLFTVVNSPVTTVIVGRPFEQLIQTQISKIT